jgi:hypothetical protein
VREIELDANKIMSQFEDFYEYIKEQSEYIGESIGERHKRCDNDLKKLMVLMPK